jgi:hypothetical protein
MPLVTISEQVLQGFHALDAKSPLRVRQSREWCARLEAGDILFFPQTPLSIPEKDLLFLRSRQQTGSALHKNIAYKPNTNTVSGLDAEGAAASGRLCEVMQRYSRGVEQFLAGFLLPYETRWHLDYASFRPQEEQGRDLPLRRRNDLLHTDAFPTRPTQGARILRFFNNLHPSRTRDWVVGDPFGVIVPDYAPGQISLPKPEGALGRALRSTAKGTILGNAIPSLKRSPYDSFMMRFHNFLKENASFQETCTKYPLQFPPGSSWMVYTDMVPHAVLAGQYALEQTLLVDHQAMLAPEESPLTVLEAMTHSRLV